MASSRKKQDEKNLKTLREVGTLQYNKYCFDCNQRGPTYVNVTIGSFVCTKCSGMLRGLTPPHRVKSISMATFTTEEIDLLKNRGNDYCKRVWLGLYEDSPLKDSNDEQAIRDHMINKYERKRYYLDPAQALRNGYAKAEPVVKNSVPETKPLKTLVTDPKPLQVNGNMNYKDRPRKVAENRNTADFVADFDRADIFNSANNNHINNNNNNGFCNGMQGGFANFDTNPIFNNTNPPATSSVVSVNNINQQKMLSANQSPPPPPPVEDKYAALKDLDNELKSQNQENILKSNVSLDWTSQAGSNGSTYSSPTPTMYSSSSSQNSVFGSPTQGSYMNGFAQNENAPIVNPFSNGVIQWQNNNMVIGVQQTYANPFRAMDAVKMNGFSQPVQNGGSFAVVGNGASPWTTVNPFKVGATMGSNNPFL